MSSLFWLTDEQMARLKPFVPKKHGQPKTLCTRWKRWGDLGGGRGRAHHPPPPMSEACSGLRGKPFGHQLIHDQNRRLEELQAGTDHAELAPSP